MNLPIVHHVVVSHVKPVDSSEHMLKPYIPIGAADRRVGGPGRVSIVVSIPQHNDGRDVVRVELRNYGRRADWRDACTGTPAIVAPSWRVGKNVVKVRPIDDRRIRLD